MNVTGVLGNFTDVNMAMKAAEKTREAGYKDFDFFTPYPVHGLDRAMGVKRTILPYISFAGSITGLITALSLQWWTGAVDYKLNIGGKQLFAIQFSIPIDFELTILLTALMTVGGLFHLCRIPTWWHPFQHDEKFKRATDDEYVLGIYVTDTRFNVEQAQKFVQSLGAKDVRIAYGESASEEVSPSKVPESVSA